MRTRCILLCVPGGLIVLLIGGVFWLRAGEVGPVPEREPIVVLNEKHADQEDNAAKLYEQAFAALEPAAGDEPVLAFADGFPQDPVPPEVVEWVRDNERAAKLATQAAGRDACWFEQPIEFVQPGGNVYARMRMLARLFAVRAAVAMERGDWEGATRALITNEHTARHVAEGPGLIPLLVAYAMGSVGDSMLLELLAHPEITPEERAACARRWREAWTPPESLKPRLEHDLEQSVWTAVQLLDEEPSVRTVVTPERLSGELRWAYAPYLALAGEPPEVQCDWDSEHYARIVEVETALQEVSWTNLPRKLAADFGPPGCLIITVHNREIGRRRALRTLCDIFIHEGEHGEFPASLDALTDVPDECRTDPFSGRPFVYRRSEDDFTLYSVGFDRDDDGGVHTEKRGERDEVERLIARPNGDYVYWPIPERAERETREAAPPPATQPAASRSAN